MGNAYWVSCNFSVVTGAISCKLQGKEHTKKKKVNISSINGDGAFWHINKSLEMIDDEPL